MLLRKYVQAIRKNYNHLNSPVLFKKGFDLKMIGLLVNEVELREIKYLLKRELEELLMDLGDPRIDGAIKEAMQKRHKSLFNLFKRVAPKQEHIKYVLYRYD